MMLFNNKIKKYILIFSISLLSLVYAETFRTSKVHFVEIKQELNFETQKKIGTNESLNIKLPENKDFIEGIEIKFEIPQAIASWQDCVACSIYNRISPSPTPNQIDFQAEKQFVKTLPNRLSWIIQIPLKANNSIKENKIITKTETIDNLTDNNIFLRLQPVMKGVPEDVMNSTIDISVKPILSNNGKIKFSFETAEELQPFTLYIDDKPSELTKENTLILEKGIHNISIISPYYRNELRTVRVEQATTTEVQIQLNSIEPMINVSAPEGASVFVDDVQIFEFNKELPVSEGEHKVKFVIGDYEIFKTITILNGKTYNLTCSIDLNIEEN